MKNILILGAGKSSSILLKQLIKYARTEGWRLTIGDQSPDHVKTLTGDSSLVDVRQFDSKDSILLRELVMNADIVISMLPNFLHPLVAEACLEIGKDMITASYVSDVMKEMDKAAKKKGILFLNEIGVDPGIDHMSAMQVINRIRDEGGKITAFESFTGGLLAPESEKDNPWKYKFTWNPRNVVLAGQGIVKFKQEGKFKYIPYHRLFRRTEIIHIPGYGYFEGYGNRDSLKYEMEYGLQDTNTIYRGTLRRSGFSRTWNAFVQLGATDDTFKMENSEQLTNKEFINSFLYYNPTDSVELKLAHYMGWDIDSEEMHRMKWLGIFDDTKAGLKDATPAQMLQKILENKWSLNEEDKDMIVMWHKFNYEINGQSKELHASMVVTGDDRTVTAMAKTVGLPVAIATKLILQGKINLKGVMIPTVKEIYEPVLLELSESGIKFKEREVIENA